MFTKYLPGQCIACSWKRDKPCTTSQWLTGMSFYLALEKISYMVKNKLDKFWKIWKVFCNFLDKNDIEVDCWNDELTEDLCLFIIFYFDLVYTLILLFFLPPWLLHVQWYNFLNIYIFININFHPYYYCYYYYVFLFVPSCYMLLFVN